MIELDATTAPAYLEARLGLPASCLRVTELGGGVSNTVLLVEAPERRFVVKQSLAKLRVEEDWFSDRTRIFHECLALQALAPHLSPGSVPEILFEDRENFLFAMSAAPAGARAWKELLLAGVIREDTAVRVGRMLAAILRAGRGALHSTGGAGQPFLEGRAVFDQLRLDPYYRFTGSRHPDLAGFFAGLVDESSERCYSLVHGDWSPKNFLVDGESVMAIDFEVIHFGDPSFDAAFLLNHFLLKSFYRPHWVSQYRTAALAFWRTLAAGLPEDAGWYEAATLRHLGGLLLARIDGKSPAEYIRTDALKDSIRRFARTLILDPPGTVPEVFDRIPAWN